MQPSFDSTQVDAPSALDRVQALALTPGETWVFLGVCTLIGIAVALRFLAWLESPPPSVAMEDIDRRRFEHAPYDGMEDWDDVA